MAHRLPHSLTHTSTTTATSSKQPSIYPQYTLPIACQHGTQTTPFTHTHINNDSHLLKTTINIPSIYPPDRLPAWHTDYPIHSHTHQQRQPPPQDNHQYTLNIPSRSPASMAHRLPHSLTHTSTTTATSSKQPSIYPQYTLPIACQHGTQTTPLTHTHINNDSHLPKTTINIPSIYPPDRLLAWHTEYPINSYTHQQRQPPPQDNHQYTLNIPSRSPASMAHRLPH